MAVALLLLSEIVIFFLLMLIAFPHHNLFKESVILRNESRPRSIVVVRYLGKVEVAGAIPAEGFLYF